MFQITITVHAKSRKFGYLGEILEQTVETTDDERIRQFAFGGSMLATFAARRFDLGSPAGDSSGDNRQSYRFDRGHVVIEIGPDVADPAERDAELQAEAEIAGVLQAAGDLVTAEGTPLQLEAGELEQTKGPRTVNQINAVTKQLQRRLDQAVARGGADRLFRIVVDPWAFAGKFEICLVRIEDDRVLAHTAAGHNATSAELYRIGADAFHAGIAAEIEQILQQSSPERRAEIRAAAASLDADARIAAGAAL